MARDHVLDVVLDAPQVIEGIDAVEPPLVASERMPQHVQEVMPAARGVRRLLIRPPQRVHLAEKPHLSQQNKILTKFLENTSI